MSQTVTLSDALYARLAQTARQRGLQSIEQLIEAWQTMDDELARRRVAVQRVDAVRERMAATYGVQPDSTDSIRADRSARSAGGRIVTTLLETAFAEASRLPPEEQDALARWLLEELASERRWAAAFAQRPDLLEQLADKALAEHGAGRTVPLDPDAL